MNFRPKNKSMEKNDKRSVMLSLVRQWRQSGKSQKEFAHEHNLPIHTLRYWLYKQGRAAKSPEGFVRLNVPTLGNGLKLRYPNGIELHFPPGLPVSAIKAFIRV